jgi:hypothetical protein
MDTQTQSRSGATIALGEAQALNIRLIGTLAARRVGEGRGEGARATAGAARPRMDLTEITENRVDGKAERVTPLGRKTARIRLPKVLQRLDRCDPKRLASDAFEHASEKIGSVAASSAEAAKLDGGAGSTDGGASTRVRHATTIRKVEAALGKGNALEPKNARGNRRPITALKLVESVVLDHMDMKAILVGHGWSGHRREIGQLMTITEEMLEKMAVALGIV